MKPIVKKVLIGGGVAALAIFAFKKFKVSLSPQDKMTQDAFDPSTPFGRALKGYMAADGRPYNAASIQAAITGWYFSPKGANDPWTIAYNRKQAWKKDEVVTL